MTLTSQNPSKPRMALTELPVGKAGRVCSLGGGTELCQRLREMGVCESVVIEKMLNRSTLLCMVCGMRVALAKNVAKHITVELIGNAA